LPLVHEKTGVTGIKILFYQIRYIMKTSSRTDVYQIITDLIIEKLESGTIPWKQPWSDYGPACNYLSKKPYRGINQLILNGLHSKPFYLTFHQAKSLGGRIKKGAKSLPVTYWNFVYRDIETNRKLSEQEAISHPGESLVKKAFLKYYRSFNIDDVLQMDFDLPEIQANSDSHSIAQCDNLLFEMKDQLEIRHQENKAYYDPVDDYINMPTIELFKTSELYYSILHHELIHFTGHPKRLNRFESDEVSNFFTNSYCLEELTAEIGAAFLNYHTGILNDETLTDSSAYIQGWLKKLRNDKRFIIEASGKAQKAVDYILSLEVS
jgi:antirestriction protein ArdC